MGNSEHCASPSTEFISDRLLNDGVSFEVYTARCFVKEQDTAAANKGSDVLRNRERMSGINTIMAHKIAR